MSSIPSIYAPMLKSYLKNQTNQKINSTQKGDNDCSMSRGDWYRTNKIKKKKKTKKPRLIKTREKKVIYREIPQLEADISNREWELLH